ncbi:hypothetical protein J437_LFUL005057 [Ladona fulva]|uniref:ENTH domain-containing protein n=1 Tax=Ladona fulva TaxID=123851 RepID=A0A8K0P7K7_LADFU|nr:hypothetical protein J437_LFUL005057 [Ladona fulva]
MNPNNVMTDIADKLAFSNYLTLMNRATADDTEPTPGYVLEEIEKITFINVLHCNRLVGYLLQRLGRQSNNVKLKVLKIMNHLVRKGHANFRIILRKSDGHIKLSTVNRKLNNSKDKSHEAVVRAADNLLQVLFDAEQLRKDEEGSPEEPQMRPKLGSMGSQGVPQGKYEGFGNSPVEKESFKGKMMDYFEKWLNPSEDLSSDMKSILYSSPGQYRPPAFDDDDDPSEIRVKQIPVTDAKKEVKAHIPGRAGGGWETDEEEEHKNFTATSALKMSNSSNITSSSESIERLDMLTAKENTAETKFVENFCETNIFPVSTIELDRAMKQCSKMDGIKILQSINNYLVSHCQSMVKETPKEEALEQKNDNVHESKQLLLGLLLLEWFLHVGKVAPEIILAVVKPALITLLQSATSFTGVHMKAQKLKLIIDKGK